MEPQSWYKGKIDQYTEELGRLKRIITTIAISRLISFIVFALAVYKWITTHTNEWMITTIVLLVIFIVLVRMAIRLNEQKALLEKLHFINTNEQGVLRHQPNQFDNGQQFATGEDFSGDL